MSEVCGGCCEDLSTVMMHVWGVWRVWWGPTYCYDACMSRVEGVVRTYLLLWCIYEVYGGCIYCCVACMRGVKGVVRTYLLLWCMSEVFGRCGKDLCTIMMHVWGVLRVLWGPIYCYDACLRCMEEVVRTYLLIWCMPEVCRGCGVVLCCISEVCGGWGEDLSSVMMHVWGVWRVWWGPILL